MSPSPITYMYPGLGHKMPPVKMEDVPLTEDDVLFHLRTNDEPYMLVMEQGSWTHLVGCVLSYVMQRQDMFNICLQSYVRELLKQPERFEIFKKTLRKRMVIENERKK